MRIYVCAYIWLYVSISCVKYSLHNYHIGKFIIRVYVLFINMLKNCILGGYIFENNENIENLSKKYRKKIKNIKNYEGKGYFPRGWSILMFLSISRQKTKIPIGSDMTFHIFKKFSTP